MWLVLVLYVVAAVAIGLGAATIAGGLPVALILLGRVYFALEANGLRRWTCERHGYRLIGVVEGRGLAEAELRFFADWLEATPDAPASRRSLRLRSPASPPLRNRRARSVEAVGGSRRAGRPLPVAGRDIAVTIALIDYGAGNLRSAEKAFER